MTSVSSAVCCVLVVAELYQRGAAAAALESSCGTFLLIAAVLGCLLLCAACLMCYLAARLHSALSNQLHAKSLDMLVREHSRRFHRLIRRVETDGHLSLGT